MKYLFLLPVLLLMACAEEAAVESIVPVLDTLLVEKAKDTTAVSLVAPQLAAPSSPTPEPPTPPLRVHKCPFSVVVNKMYTTLHLGVDNLVRVEGTGYSFGPYKVTVSGASIRREIGDFYIVNPSKEGHVLLTVSTPKDEVLWEFPFYAKRFPDRTIKLGGISSGEMTLSKFIDRKWLTAWPDSYLPDLGFDCKVTGFRLRRITQEGNITAVLNQGQMFTSETQELISAARIGDIYVFDNTTLRCPGDQADRLANSLVFDIA